MANVRECFVSRFVHGRIVEFDYSQLEVVGAAEVSGDPMMKKDILDGVDSHSQSAAWLNPKHSYEEIYNGYLAEDPYFTKMRKAAKAPRFELQYGAGATSIAANNNLSIEVANEFIERYYDRYKVLKAYQDSVREAVEFNKFDTGKRTGVGNYPIHGGVFKSITGRRYYFEEELAPEWLRKRGTNTSFSPTKFKNYWSQGFATGDIVPEMLGRVLDYLLCHDLIHDILPIMTVHDSVVFDFNYGIRPQEELRRIKKVMEDVPYAMKDRFGLELTLPYKVGVSMGSNWFDQKEIKF